MRPLCRAARRGGSRRRRLPPIRFPYGSGGVALTEDGLAFLDQARAAIEAADAALGLLGERRGEITGRVHLGAGVAFGRLHIVPRLAPLLA